MSLRQDVRQVARGWRWTHRPLVPRSVELPDAEPHDFPTAWARTEIAKAARAALQGYALKPLIQHEVKPRVEGLDVLQDLRAPVIFIANHSSHLDAPLVLTSLPPAWRERTATGAAADYFFDVWWRAAATALVFNAFPVERSGGKGRATHLAGEMIRDGWSLLVFPEGTRSKDGWVRDFRMGAARLAVDHSVPVVPVALRGTYQAMPRGAAWPAKGRKPVTVRFGRALQPRDGETATDFNERMRAGLALTLNEDRTTWWDAIRNGSDAGGPQAARWRRVWEASAPMPTARKAFPER
ncbi:MAG TPA: lysophospholipid acyltransferase family protein [Actinomycetota bacterium]|nr:lysophospholipid acyltransferase family protein [Actinomycetota bacterium]